MLDDIIYEMKMGMWIEIWIETHELCIHELDMEWTLLLFKWDVYYIVRSYFMENNENWVWYEWYNYELNIEWLMLLYK